MYLPHKKYTIPLLMSIQGILWTQCQCNHKKKADHTTEIVHQPHKKATQDTTTSPVYLIPCAQEEVVEKIDNRNNRSREFFITIKNDKTWKQANVHLISINGGIRSSINRVGITTDLEKNRTIKIYVSKKRTQKHTFIILIYNHQGHLVKITQPIDYTPIKT